MLMFFVFFLGNFRIEQNSVTQVLKMHVEENRSAFRHVHNFKTFVDELYSARECTEEQTS